MNERYSIQELTSLLSGKTGKTKKDSELFLRELVAIITEGVFQDRIVKVKGFGTFKVILVEKRESIHVNTGERFVIPAHHKFTFLPDKDLKVLVNKPFSFFETTQMSDDVEIGEIETMIQGHTLQEEVGEEEEFDLREEEVVVIKKEVEATMDSSLEEMGEPVLEAETPGEPEEELLIVENQEITKEVTVEESLEESAIEAETEIEGVKIAAESTNTVSSVTAPVEHKKKQGGNAGKMIGLAIGTVAILLIIFGVYWYMMKGSASTDPLQVTGRPAQQEQLALSDNSELSQPEQNNNAAVVPEEGNADEAFPNTEDPQLATPDEQPPTEPSVQSSDSDIIGQVTIKLGDRLTLYAEEYYGDKIFWVYIYDFNKEIIGDPNNIISGMELSIPAPAIYGIDANSRESLNKARAFQREILTRYR